jgi:hypothetical protein
MFINIWINTKYITKITDFILFCLILCYCSPHDFTDFHFFNSHNIFETISAERILQSCLCVAVFFFKTIWLVQKFVKIWNSCNNGAGPSQGLKIRGGGARSTVVGIICPPGWDTVNCLAKNWGGSPAPPLATALWGEQERSVPYFQRCLLPIPTQGLWFF